MSNTPAWPSTVAVVGAAGLIGSGVVERIALGGLADKVYAIDLRENVVAAHLIDIRESQIFAQSTKTELIAGPPAEGSVDLVFVAASAPENPDGDRKDFLRANLELLRKIIPTIEALAGSDGLVVLLSNPVDVLAECFVALSDIPRGRVIGYSLNDTMRLKAAVSRELGVDPGGIDVSVLGEHGAGQVPVFSQLRIDGRPFELTTEQKSRIVADINGWFGRWSALKPGRSTGWSTPRGVALAISAMRAGELHPVVVSTDQLDGDPAFVGVPARRVNGEMVVELGDLSENELSALREAARSITAASVEALALMD